LLRGGGHEWLETGPRDDLLVVELVLPEEFLGVADHVELLEVGLVTDEGGVFLVIAGSRTRGGRAGSGSLSGRVGSVSGWSGRDESEVRHGVGRRHLRERRHARRTRRRRGDHSCVLLLLLGSLLHLAVVGSVV